MTIYSLTYSFPYLEPFCCSMSSSNYCFLTCVRNSQEASQVVWYAHLFKNFPVFVVVPTVKGFGIVNKADVFLELSLFPWSSGCWQFDLWFLSFFKTSLNIWNFMVHILLKPGFENFEHYFTSVWEECNCAVVEHSLALPFLEIGMKTPFPVLWPLLSFPNLLAYWVQHFHSIIF